MFSIIIFIIIGIIATQGIINITLKGIISLIKFGIIIIIGIIGIGIIIGLTSPHEVFDTILGGLIIGMEAIINQIENSPPQA